MGQAKLRKSEIAALKAAGNNGKNTAIDFKFNLMDHQYSLLAVYEPQVIDQMRANDYDNEKCLDIIVDCSRNILAVKNDADISDPKARQAVENSMRYVALAVLRHAVLDPYRSAGLRPDCVLSMTLEEDADENVGYDLAGEGLSVFLMKRGVQSRIDSAQTDSTDFCITLA
jgi:hypothetical protein